MAWSSEPLRNGRGVTANLLQANIYAQGRENLGIKKASHLRDGNRPKEFLRLHAGIMAEMGGEVKARQIIGHNLYCTYGMGR